MFRAFNTAVFICLGLGGLFLLEQEVRTLEQQKRRLTTQVEESTESLRILKAEWSYLSSPSRLAELNRRYLGLAPLATSQIVNQGQLAALLAPDDTEK